MSAVKVQVTTMFSKIKQFTALHPRFKRAVGWVFIVVGFVALVTPLTPGGFLFLVGLEFLGLRFVFLDRLFRRKKAAAIPLAEQTPA
jgi:Putative transmembrane protein (PGPGW)